MVETVETVAEPKKRWTKATNGSVQAGAAPGGTIRDVPVRGTTTAAAVLKQAGVKTLKGREIKVNGKRAEPETEVVPGDTVLAVGKVRGG